MKIQKYKPGLIIYLTSKNKNQYYQSYWYGKLWYKGGYYNINKKTGYKESYIWRNKGLKYRI
jgi:hypothetical protein